MYLDNWLSGLDLYYESPQFIINKYKLIFSPLHEKKLNHGYVFVGFC